MGRVFYRLKREFAIDGKDENTSISGTPKVRQQTEVAEGGGLSYKILPYVDQHDMYSSVYKRLKEGGCIGIFPEGQHPSYCDPSSFVSLCCLGPSKSKSLMPLCVLFHFRWLA